MEHEIARDLGKHDAQIDALNARVDLLHQDLVKMMEKLSSIENTLSEAKGGWRTLMFVSGMSAAIGGLIVKVATWMQLFPR
jgi:prefoldin subunit 5